MSAGVSAALQFGAGAIAIELLLVRLSIAAVGKLQRLHGYLKWFSGLSVLLLLALGIVSITDALQMKEFENSLPLQHIKQPFVFGVFLSLLNPLHLPFWAGWTAVLKQKGLFAATGANGFYITGIGAGTAAAFALYAVAGGPLIQSLHSKQYVVNWVLGVTLIGMALAQFYKLIFTPNKLQTQA